MLLSFIVPVYNTEKYLKECLNSLLSQKAEGADCEVICVNDGSTDDSLSILQKYETKYSNVQILNQNNAGVCAARNAGLAAATGEYVWFIDSDDCIRPDALLRLRQMMSGEIDRIVFGSILFMDGTHPFDCPEALPKNTIWQDSSACLSIFRRRFLLENNISFHYPELVFGEDALFMYEVKYASPRTAVIEDTLYGYRERENSACRDLSKETLHKHLHSTIREAEIMKAYYESGRADSMTADRFMSYLFGALYHVAGMENRETRREFLREIREKGLFPYRRPKSCTLRKSYQMNRGDWVEKIHDRIYINLSTRMGFAAMRCWNEFFNMKKKLKRL